MLLPLVDVGWPIPHVPPDPEIFGAPPSEPPGFERACADPKPGSDLPRRQEGFIHVLRSHANHLEEKRGLRIHRMAAALTTPNLTNGFLEVVWVRCFVTTFSESLMEISLVPSFLKGTKFQI